MRQQIDVLREVLVEWLVMYELDDDCSFYTRDEWREWNRGSDRASDADLVLVHNDDLAELLHLTGPCELQEEFEAIAQGCGYHLEFLDSYSMGFYADEDSPPLPAIDASEEERLQDGRWLSKRAHLIERMNNRCSECGAAEQPLEVHRCYDQPGREPWQYPDGAFLLRCPECLPKRKDSERRFRLFLPRVSSDDLDLLRQFVEHFQYWYDPAALREFLLDLMKQKTMTGDYAVLRDKFEHMLKTAGQPDERGAEWPRHSEPGWGFETD
jgi:hypothetical protein